MISDNRLRWLSGPDYIRSEPGQVAAELLAARGTIAALEARCQQADAILAIVKRHAVMMMAIARYYPPETNRDPTPEHLLKQGYRSGKATDPTSQETKANPPGCICRYEHKSDPMCQYEPETKAEDQ